MRVLAAALILCGLMGCDPAPTGGASNQEGAARQTAIVVSSSPEAKLCARAYGQTVSALGDIAKKAGVDLPKMPDKNAYVETCVASGFTEDQAKCLDPKWFQGDAEACAAALAPKKAEKAKLDRMFADALNAANAPPEPAKPEGTQAPQEDVGAAVEAALGGQ